MGLWLGVSVLTFTEILTFGAILCLYGCRRMKKEDKDGTAKDGVSRVKLDHLVTVYCVCSYVLCSQLPVRCAPNFLSLV